MPMLQRGISLIELLLSIGLGLIVSLFLLEIYTSNKTTYRVQEGLAQLQQTGRLASYFIAKDARMVGFQGCTNNINSPPTNLISIPPDDADFTMALLGYEASSNNWSPNLPSSLNGQVVSGTDVITIRRVNAKSMSLTTNMSSKSSDLAIADRVNSSAGDFFIINDCQTADLFKASAGTGSTTITHRSPNNVSNELSKAYDTSAKINKLETARYYVGDTGRRNFTNQPILALFRMDINGNKVELVEGVENLQLNYGIDTDADGAVDTFATAGTITTNTQWDKVMSVRISLLVSTVENVSPTSESYTFAGTTVNNPSDKKLRKQWDVYISLRNRVL
jgi:type IV pilus assembly protein PilW